MLQATWLYFCKYFLIVMHSSLDAFFFSEMGNSDPEKGGEGYKWLASRPRRNNSHAKQFPS